MQLLRDIRGGTQNDAYDVRTVIKGRTAATNDMMGLEVTRVIKRPIGECVGAGRDEDRIASAVRHEQTRDCSYLVREPTNWIDNLDGNSLNVSRLSVRTYHYSSVQYDYRQLRNRITKW